MRLSSLIALCVAVGAAAFVLNNQGGLRDGSDQAVARASTQTHTIRMLTSATCPADGCPTACSPNETLVSAFCVRASAARLAETLQVADGALTARCGANSDSIILYCAHK